MTRRGLSLTEVLVALFIMAIGLIAILTMFPLGALQMGQALKDDRTAQAAASADGYIRWYWKQYVTGISGTGTPDPLAAALDNPTNSPLTGQPTPAPKGGGGGPLWFRGGLVNIPADDSGPSYPVAVDPMGFYRPFSLSPNGGLAQQYWVGPTNGFPATRLPRRNLQLVESQPAANRAAFALRTCSLLDGIAYDANGRGVNAGGQVERELRYNWLWVLQRPNNRERKVIGVTVVVFDKRAHQYSPRARNPEPTYNPVYAQVGETRLTFATAVPAQKGGWIADVTWTNPPGATPGVRNCNFYRVVSVTENAGVYDVELQTPLRPDSTSQNTPPIVTPTQRTFVVMDGVSEVFERTPIMPGDQ